MCHTHTHARTDTCKHTCTHTHTHTHTFHALNTHIHTQCLAQTKHRDTHQHTLSRGSVVFNPTVPEFVKVTVNCSPLPTPLQCPSPLSTALLPFAPCEDIQSVICSKPVSEPHYFSRLVHWCGFVCTHQRKRKQERAAHTLHIALLRRHIYKRGHREGGMSPKKERNMSAVSDRGCVPLGSLVMKPSSGTGLSFLAI